MRIRFVIFVRNPKNFLIIMLIWCLLFLISLLFYVATSRMIGRQKEHIYYSFILLGYKDCMQIGKITPPLPYQTVDILLEFCL